MLEIGEESGGSSTYMPFIPALRRQRQVDFCEFEVTLLYNVSSMIARTIQRNPVWKKKSKEKKTGEQIGLGINKVESIPYKVYTTFPLQRKKQTKI